MFAQLTFVLACLSASVRCDEGLSEKEVLSFVIATCAEKEMMCPKEEYARYSAEGWTWNVKGVLASSALDTLRKGDMTLESSVRYAREKFCCVRGSCLKRCGISVVSEIDLVRNFPKNVNQIFALHIEDLEKVRPAVLEWIEDYKLGLVRKPYPEEVEVYFDLLNLHHAEILRRLRLRRERA
ncbi:unnamed protein product [Caenorhabditis sp. 36 PRJEB53466]|nr:unnamed protein product [Caenorhabditis sp. 36 PRJEB53466]